MRKEIKLGLVLVVLIIGMVVIFNKQEKQNYKNALDRCNGSVELRYNNNGDKYYICK